MNGVKGLANVLQQRMRRAKKENSQQAQRGTIVNGKVRLGARSYPFRVAVDCNTGEGASVWVQLTKNGTAVVIGA